MRQMPGLLSVYFESPVQSVLLLYSRLALGLVARAVKKNRQLGLTVLKQGAVHLQTKNVVVYNLNSFHFPSGPPACRKVKSDDALLLASKPSIQVVDFFNGSGNKARP